MESHSVSSFLSLMKKDEDQAAKSLYIRMPHTIRDESEIEKLLIGDGYTVKLPRQVGRHCSVIFSSLEEKSRNLKALKGKLIDGKPIVARRVIRRVRKHSQKNLRKKISIPKAEPDARITQTLYLTSIKCGVSAQEVKEALPGCTNVTFLKAYNKDFRSAKVKMESLQMAREYLTKEREWPLIRGFKLKVHPDTRCRHKKRKKRVEKDILSNGAD